MSFTRIMEEAARQDVSLTLAKLAVMEQIMVSPKSMNDLAKAAQHSTAAATGLVDCLEKQGLAQRCPTYKDLRIRMVQPTIHGREVFDRILNAQAEEVES